MPKDELIAALEAATGPDRELDAAIFAAVYPDKVPSPIVESGYGWRFAGDGWWLATGEDTRVAPKTVTPPRFTASIDAALTLVEPGLGFKLDRYWIGFVDHAVWSAHITRGGLPDRPFKSWEAWDATTPALAICIAALKARP